MSESRHVQQTDASSALASGGRMAWLKAGNVTCRRPVRKPDGQAWRVVLLGAPGVGKGTQAELLSQRLGPCHLSTGDIFRCAKGLAEAELSPAIHEALEFMKSGRLVPDATVLGLVRERLRCLNCPGGFLLDGFPRTVAQAEAFEELLEADGIPLTAVFNYDLSPGQIISRIAGRRTCSHCLTVYHTDSRPPKIPEVCDKCGGKLFQREDDLPVAAKVRMEAYQKSTAPLIEFYRWRGLLVTIDAHGSPEEIFQRTLRLAPGR